ncbi:MAG: exodeoxyribonuclease VII small subunit [Clostridiales bacterium]|nr:exodeoxyribonuclease VII small subunit [Clostridiales bacterium]
MKKKSDPQTFEMQLIKLEQLVNQMEQGGLSLEEMLKAYEEGQQLQKELQAILEQTKGKFTSLQEKEGPMQESFLGEKEE